MRQRILVHMSLAVLCIIVLGLGTNIHAAEKHLFGVITIRITGNGHKSQSGGGDKGTAKWENSYEHSLNLGCRITVCEEEGELKVLNYDPYGTEQWTKEYARKEDHKICPLTEEQMKHNPLYRQKHYPPNIKRPGDSERAIERFNASINLPHGRTVTYVKQETPRVEFDKYPNGMYSLRVSGELEMATIFKSKTTYHYVCDNRDVKSTLETAPNMPSNASSSGDGNSYISGPSTPQVRPLFFTADKIGLQGSKTVYERIDEDNGYRETAIASWEFKRISTSCDCNAIVDMATGTRAKDTTSSASERAAISSVRNRIKSLHLRVTRIKGLVRVYRNNETKISRLQKQQRSLKIKTGPQELKRASNISIQSDRWAANSQHTIHSVRRESQTLLTETQQLMTEVQRLHSTLKAASAEDLERLAAEAAGLANLTGAVQDVLDVEYKGNCWDLPNFDACIECCKSRNKITADPGTQIRESQEAHRSICIRMCDIITAREEASTNAEDAMEEQKDILKMLQDLMKQKQE